MHAICTICSFFPSPLEKMTLHKVTILSFLWSFFVFQCLTKLMSLWHKTSPFMTLNLTHRNLFLSSTSPTLLLQKQFHERINWKWCIKRCLAFNWSSKYTTLKLRRFITFWTDSTEWMTKVGLSGENKGIYTDFGSSKVRWNKYGSSISNRLIWYKVWTYLPEKKSEA